MNLLKKSAKVASSVLLAGALLSGPAIAQQKVPPKPGPVKASTLECCKCIEGTSQTTIHTGKPGSIWTVSGPSLPSAPATNASNVAWTTTVLTNAGWISPSGNPTAVGNYVYQTSVDLRNKCIIPSDVTVSVKFLADNVGILQIGGSRNDLISSVGTPNYGFLPGSLTSYTYNVPASEANGSLPIQITAQNSGGPTGMIAEVTVTRTCTKELETKPKNQ